MQGSLRHSITKTATWQYNTNINNTTTIKLLCYCDIVLCLVRLSFGAHPEIIKYKLFYKKRDKMVCSSLLISKGEPQALLIATVPDTEKWQSCPWCAVLRVCFYSKGKKLFLVNIFKCSLFTISIVSAVSAPWLIQSSGNTVLFLPCNLFFFLYSHLELADLPYHQTTEKLTEHLTLMGGQPCSLLTPPSTSAQPFTL